MGLFDYLSGWTGEMPAGTDLNSLFPTQDIQAGDWITGSGPTLTNSYLTDMGYSWSPTGDMTLPDGSQIMADGTYIDIATGQPASLFDQATGALTAIGSKVAGLLSTKIGNTGQTVGGLIGQTVAPALGGYATNQAQIDLQKQQMNQTQQNLAPWLIAGTGALNKMGNWDTTHPMPTTPQFQNLNYDPNNYFNSPVYNALMKSGTDALNAKGASAGMLGSGNQAAALQQLGMQTGANYLGADYNIAQGNNQSLNQNLMNTYNADMGENTTGYNRLASMAGVGQTAANTLSAAGQTGTNNLIDTTGNQGTNATMGISNLVNQLFGGTK